MVASSARKFLYDHKACFAEVTLSPDVMHALAHDAPAAGLAGSAVVAEAAREAMSRGTADAPLMTFLQSRVERVFSLHGASHEPAPTLMPLLLPHQRCAAADAVAIVDRTGTLLQLPYDLCYPFARQTARLPTNVQRKRYCVGYVYRQGAHGEHPKQLLEASFDITLPQTVVTPPVAAAIQAETMSVVLEALSALQPYLGPVQLVVGHVKVCHASVLGGCACACSCWFGSSRQQYWSCAECPQRAARPWCKRCSRCGWRPWSKANGRGGPFASTW